MSHIAEEYAKSLGVKIGYPVLRSHFFPLVSDKYVTLQTAKKFEARNYSFWDYTVSLLRSYIPDYDIVQVGTSDDPFCKSTTHQILSSPEKPTSFNNLFYIISNASLHVGIDSLGMHVASVYDIPSVGLYPNMYPSNSGPLWNRQSRSICIEPDRKGLKPSFRRDEDPKTVDFIKPETIVRAVLELLDVPNDLDTYHTLKMGSYYPNSVLEVIPNFIPQSPPMPGTVANIRCDYELKEECLPYWLSRRCNLMVSKAVSLSTLMSFKPNIAALTIFLGDESITPDYLRSLNSLNLKFTLISKNKEKLNDFRFEFFDWSVEEYMVPAKKDIDFGDKICDNTFYHSNKVLISQGKEYYSKAAWENKIEKTQSHQKLIDSDSFWEEIEHLNIYNHGAPKKE